MRKEIFIYPIYPINGMSRMGNIYKQGNIYIKMKKRVDITLDVNIVEAIEEMRSKEKFKPPLSQVINSLLKENKEVKKRLKNNGKKV